MISELFDSYSYISKSKSLFFTLHQRAIISLFISELMLVFRSFPSNYTYITTTQICSKGNKHGNSCSVENFSLKTDSMGTNGYD